MHDSINNLNTLFGNSLFQNRDKKAIVFGDEIVTYKELYGASNRVANALLKSGVKPNTRVALLMSNCVEYSMCDLGIIQAGATKVPLNDMLGEKEIAYILKDSGAKVLFVDLNFFDIIEKIRPDLPELETIVGISHENQCPTSFITWNNFQGNEAESEVKIQVAPDDMAIILYTGGTTGRPKGVVHTQQNIMTNVYSHVIELELQEEEKILLTSPLPHSAGFIMSAGLSKGATHYIQKKFNPLNILKNIENDRITLTFMVPTMIYRLLDAIEQQTIDYDLSSLRTIVYGASPITTERLKQGLSIFGSVFTQLYGQSEAPNFITRLKKSDHHLSLKSNEDRLKSCGQPVMMAAVKIVDELGMEVSNGTPGEIAAKTPYNMIYYHKKAEETKKALKDGWVLTGDLGMMDEDGYVYLLDRKKDMIITGGMNVYTTEVENVIQKHQGVSQVAVIGIPDSDWGEKIIAFVVPKDNVTTPKDIINLCKQELSKYKRPKKITLVNSLPVTPYGKVDKKLLRKPYWEDAYRNVH